MVELTCVWKAYGGVGVVNGVSLAIERGRTTALVGPSGSGKSTLLRMVNGLCVPDRGEVKVGGEALDRGSVLGIRRRMGYVIQEGGLFPHRSARDNVTLMARHLGWDAPRIDARVAELRDLVRLADPLLDRYPVQLSGGERQRVSLMRALMLEPEVLLLDEPLGALDPMIRADLRADLRAIFQRLGKSVLIVTHDLNEASVLGDAIVLLRDGRVVQKGTRKDLVESPADAFVTRFVSAQAWS